MNQEQLKLLAQARRRRAEAEGGGDQGGPPSDGQPWPTQTPIPLSPHERQQGRIASTGIGGIPVMDEASGALAGVSSLLKGKGFVPAYEAERDKFRKAAGDYQKENPWSAAGMSAVGSAPLALATGGVTAAPTLLGRMGQGAATGGAYGAATGFAGGEGGLQPRLEGAAKVGIPSAVMGAATPAITQGAANAGKWLGSRLGAIGTAGAVDPEIASLAQRAKALDVPIRPAQASPISAFRAADDQLSALPPILTGSSAKNPLRITPAAQHEKFTRALSRTVGEDAGSLTQDVMARVKSKIGNIYETVLPRNQIQPTPEVQGALSEIRDQAVEALDEDSIKPVLSALAKIEKKFGGGVLSGRQYQAMRAKGGMVSAVSDSQNPTVAHYGDKIREALDDAFQAQAQGNDGAAIRQAREWFRHYKILEPLAAKAPTGKISPTLLLGQVMKAYPDFASKGAGDIGDLARIGQQFIKAPPNSETAARSMVLRMLENPVGAAAKTAASPFIATIGRAMNSAINSPAAEARLVGNPLQQGIISGGNASVQPRGLAGLDPRMLGVMQALGLGRLMQPNNQAP